MSELDPRTKINNYLSKAVASGASDLHVKVGSPPVMRISGGLVPMTTEEKLTQEDAVKISFAVMRPRQQEIFKQKSDVDLAYSVPQLGRFRCNIFMQRGTVGLVFRVIPMRIPTIDELNLPEVIKKVCAEERGLVLVTGTTGSGKSTTLAAMIDKINGERSANIITIEDPIEYLHRDKKSIVSQREVGSDTETFAMALRAALRQDPDIILVGEMRDQETIHTAMVAAETGHLVMSTLHTTDTAETINRIISMFPPHQHQQIRIQLGTVIKAIISMRLVPKAEGQGRVPAVEVMLGTHFIKECIVESEKTKLIPDAVAQGKLHYGMQTFDQSLLDLMRSQLITYEEALRWATNAEDFKLKVKGIHSTSELSTDAQAASAPPPGMKIDRFAK